MAALSDEQLHLWVGNGLTSESAQVMEGKWVCEVIGSNIT